jgi:hypothetical protein
MTWRNHYFIGVLAIACAWFVLSMYLSFMLISIADTTDVKTIVPLWLKIVWAIVLFPLSCLDHVPIPFLSNLSDRVSGVLGMILIFINSVLWGFALMYFFRFVATLVGIKKREGKNTI